MKKITKIMSSMSVGLLLGSSSLCVFAAGGPVGITANMMSIDVTHNGQPMQIMRNQDNNNMVIDAFAKNSRPPKVRLQKLLCR